MMVLRNTVLLAAAMISQPANTMTLSEPAFTAPSMNPKQFLIITSPSEGTIVWTTLRNFQSTDMRTFALISSGLKEPKGVAFDHKNAFLYVADTGAKKIFRYSVFVDTANPNMPRLVTIGDRMIVCEGHAVEWLTVDDEGNVLYTDPVSNNINKISVGVMDEISKGTFHASMLQIVDEKTLVSKQKAQNTLSEIKKREGFMTRPTDGPPLRPEIEEIYQSDLNPHVSKPAALKARGDKLYWVNQKDGTKEGTVVVGQVDPKVVVSKHPEPFPATAMTNASSGAFGLTLAKDILFFTQNGTIPGTGLVTGVLLENPNIQVDIETGLTAPRGLVYDQDETVYVADNALGQVWSFPSGRMMAEAPLTLTVEVKGCYGLILLSASDPCFKKDEISSNGLASGDDVAESFLSVPRSSSYRAQVGLSMLLVLSALGRHAA